jgi:integrase
MKLTTASIKTIEPLPPRTDRIEFDDAVPGFGVRARTGGSKVYIVQYAIGNKQRRMSLGKVGLQGVDKARERAKDILAKVRLGHDPAGEKHQARESATDTLKDVAERFLAFQKAHGGKDGGGLRPRSLSEADRHLMTHAKALHSLLLTKIQQRDIASVLSAVRATHPVTANRVRTSLASLFSWAIGEGLVQSNPVTHTLRTEEKSRDRVLDPTELRAIWQSLGGDHFGSIMKLLALTGQRAAEIAGLRWSEITTAGVDGATLLPIPVIRLPPGRTKNHREHVVPLSEPARVIIAAQPRRFGADGELRDLIFGFGDGPFSGWGKSMEALSARIAERAGQPLSHFTPHDLRRSFATHASGLGIQPHIIEVILNHVSGFRAGVAGIYNRQAYEAEKRTALALWADQLLAIVEDRQSNVVSLREAR